MALRRTLPFLGLIALATLTQAGTAAGEEGVAYDWRTQDFSGRESTVGCGLSVLATSAGGYVTADLSVMARDLPGGEKFETRLRIAAARREGTDLLKEVPIEIHGGWLRSSSASTVGGFKTVETPTEPSYLVTAAGFQPFADLFRGIREDGAVLGFQTTPEGPDEIRQPGPPPKAASDRLIACVDRLLAGR